MDKVKDLAHQAAGRTATQSGASTEQSQYSSGQNPPAQKQDKPGLERDLEPKPKKTHLPTEDEGYKLYRASNKLAGKRALITGGDSGIGRAVSILFAMEGSRVAFTYLPEEADDARHTVEQIEKNGGRALAVAADLRTASRCREVVKQVLVEFGGIDVLVNNAAYQIEQQDIADITEEQWSRTFATNIGAVFFLSQAVVPHMASGSTIINTASVDAYIAPATHLDYAATKGAVVTFTRALSNMVAKKGIRVNAVAPGPVWTPLIATSITEDSQKQLRSWTTMDRLGQPVEIATSFVFLASQDSSYMTGQTLHPNGGIMVSG